MLKVVFTGPPKSGKTTLIKRLQDNNAEIGDYNATIAPDFVTIAPNIRLWEIPSTVESSRYSKYANIFIHCVNLSEPITDEMADAIEKQKKDNPGCKHVLIGTCLDLGKPNSLMQFSHLSKDFGTSHLRVSAKELINVETLKNVLFKQANLLDNAPNALIPTPLESLNDLLPSLPSEKQDLIRNEITSFLAEMQKESANKATLINTFESNCRRHLGVTPYPVVKAILSAIATLVVAAVVTAIAGAIGFGIGLALGLWAGPGAFFSAMTVAGSTASYVASTSIVSGFIAGGFTLFAACKSTPASEVANAVHDVAESELLNVPM